MAFGGYIVLLLAAVFALNQLIGALWASSLAIGGGAVLLGFLLLVRARDELAPKELTPEMSPESLRKDTRLLKEHLT